MLLWVIEIPARCTSSVGAGLDLPLLHISLSPRVRCGKFSGKFLHFLFLFSLLFFQKTPSKVNSLENLLRTDQRSRVWTALFRMHSHTPEETTAISDDLVLESLGYKPGKTIYLIFSICIHSAKLVKSSSVRSLCLE
jgi:hypothetical protein